MTGNNDHQDNRVNALIPILSYFTGGGLLDIGFAKAGFRVVWTNENNINFADMYEYAISSLVEQIEINGILTRISNRHDIKEIKPRKILKEAFPDGRPDIFGIIGGPPCPDFATGGKHRGHEGDYGKLSQTFVDHICSIKPSFFVFENVHGLLKTEKHRDFLGTLEKQLEYAKYCVDRRVLNSLDFGLAQDRERVFLIGVRINLARVCLDRKIAVSEREWFPWPKEKLSNARGRFEWPTVNRDDNVPKQPVGIPDELMISQLLSNIPNDMPNAAEYFKPRSDKFRTVREGDTSGKSFKRLHRYRYSPTACYGNNEVHLHPWENRRLSVREVMRIQGVPDSYILPPEATLSSKFKMIANGVPVPLAEQVATSLHKFLEHIYQEVK